MVRNLFDLKGKNALVTGSSQGIGKAIALGLAEYGANVIIHCRNEEDKANEVAEQIKSFDVKSAILIKDLSEIDAGRVIKKQSADLLGEIDILVLNASIQIKKPFADISDFEFENQINVNLRSSLQLIQHMTPDMIKNRWGRILNIGSVQQLKPHPEMMVYAATKSALVNMVKNLAKQLAGDNITVNNLAPGVILTGRNEKALSDKNYRKLVASKVPVGFFGEAEDCAGTALLLCSEAGRYITGQDIIVDGGMSL